MMKKLTPAMLAVLSLLPAVAMALAFPPRPAVADSTGIRPGVVATMVLPAPGLSETTIQNIVNNAVTGAANTNNIPQGYREIIKPMGPRQIADNELTYYGALGYTASAFGIPSFETPSVTLACAGNLAPRLVGLQKTIAGDSTSTTTTTWFVCESLGTRSTLEKVIGADVATLGASSLAPFVLAGTSGISAAAATPFCQSVGYTNFVAGSIAFTQFGSGCRDDQRITSYSNGAWVSNTICYNQRINTLQCWR